MVRERLGILALGVVGLGLAAGLAGCRSSGGGEGESSGVPAKAGAALVAGPLKVVAVDAPGGVPPMHSDAGSVEVVGRVELLEWDAQGPRERRRLVVEREGPAPGETTWRVTRTVLERIGGGADDVTPIRTDSYTLGSDGSVAIAEENNHDEKVEVVFEPPMVVMPRELGVGAPFEQKFDVKVYPGGKGRKILKSSGTATQTIEFTGLWRVTLAGGDEVEARGVRSVFRADFDPAKVVNTTEQWFVDGVGVIAERKHERTTVFGVPIRESMETWGARAVGGG